MATITLSDYFTVGGVPNVLVTGEVTGKEAMKIVSASKHGVKIAISDKEREEFAAALSLKLRCDDEGDIEPEDFNDRYDARRARWGHD